MIILASMSISDCERMGELRITDALLLTLKIAVWRMGTLK